jgi:hypothetical protein
MKKSFPHFSARKFSIGHDFHHLVGPIQISVFRDRVRLDFNDYSLIFSSSLNIDWFTAHLTMRTFPTIIMGYIFLQ